MVLAFLAPVPSTPLAESTYVDKLVHFGIFLGFALLLHSDRAPKAWWTLLISFAFAGAVELVQSFLSYRHGDWGDFVAGAAGATAGTLLIFINERRAPQPAGG
jgi:VanZ family protein